MDSMSWVTSWEKWREVMGRGAQRTNVLAYLETHPAILYWGDSWFSTPLYLNLARQSAKQIEGMGMLIGKPGAEATDLFTRGKIKEIVGRLLASPFDVLCLSAGGNDCLDDRLFEVFNEWQNDSGKDRISAEEAFARLVGSGAFEKVFEAYDALLSELEPVRNARPTFRVISHPYVPIERIGQKANLTAANIGLIAWLKGSVGPWLWKPMEAVLTDKEEGKAFADLLLVDGFKRQVLEALASKYTGLFSIVDYGNDADTHSEAFWNDEIHPTEPGFLALSRPFNKHIASRLPTEKRGSVHSDQ